MTLGERVKENWPADAGHVGLSTIRDWFNQYVAFERLRDESVLADAVRFLLEDAGAAWAYAEGQGEDGRYRGLVMPGNTVNVRFDGGAMLVRREVADRQTPAPTPFGEPGAPRGAGGAPGAAGTGDGAGAPAPRVLRRFVGEVELDPTRPIPELDKIMKEVVGQLLLTDGAKVRLRLDVEATAAGGFKTDDAAVVRDNARSLKFNPETTGFEEE